MQQDEGTLAIADGLQFGVQHFCLEQHDFDFGSTCGVEYRHSSEVFSKYFKLIGLNIFVSGTKTFKNPFILNNTL